MSDTSKRLIVLLAASTALSACTTSGSLTCTRDPVTGQLHCCADYLPPPPSEIPVEPAPQ